MAFCKYVELKLELPMHCRLGSSIMSASTVQPLSKYNELIEKHNNSIYTLALFIPFHFWSIRGRNAMAKCKISSHTHTHTLVESLKMESVFRMKMHISNVYVHLSDLSVKNLFVPENNWWWNKNFCYIVLRDKMATIPLKSNYFQTVLDAFEF